MAIGRSGTGEGPPPGENNEPVILPGATPGQSRDPGGMRGQLDTMREVLKTLGRVRTGVSDFATLLSGDAKNRTGQFRTELETLNDALSETLRLLTDIGDKQGELSEGFEKLGEASESYTQKQLPTDDERGVARDVTRGQDRDDIERTQQPQGPSRGALIAAGLGTLAVGTARASGGWYGEQVQPAAITDLLERRAAVGGDPAARDFFTEQYEQRNFRDITEIAGVQESLESRGLRFSGPMFNEITEEAGAMRQFMPHIAPEAIAGASGELRYGQVGHRLRQRGIIDWNASTDEMFRQLAKAAFGKERPPTVRELAMWNPGTVPYEVLMMLTEGDAELVRMVIEWAIADAATREETGAAPDLSRAEQQAGEIGLGKESVFGAELSRDAAESARRVDRQDEMADNIRKSAENSEKIFDWLNDTFGPWLTGTGLLLGRWSSTVLGGDFAKTVGVGLFAGAAINKMTGGRAAAATKAAAGGAWKAATAPARAAFGGGGTSAPAGTPGTGGGLAGGASAGGRVSGVLGTVGRVVGPVGVAAAALHEVGKSREEAAVVRALETNDWSEVKEKYDYSDGRIADIVHQRSLSTWDKIRGAFGFGPGKSGADVLFEEIAKLRGEDPWEDVDEDDVVEPAGGPEFGWTFKEGGLDDAVPYDDPASDEQDGEVARQALPPGQQSTMPPLGQIRGADHTGSGYSRRGFGGVKPHVAQAGHYLNQAFGPFPGGIGGVGQRSGPSDHPRGLALDLMTNNNRALGDRVVNFLSRNWRHFAVKYIIWKQRINTGDGRGWRKMEDRGSITANHFDHPHISFQDAPSSGGSSSSGVEPYTEDGDERSDWDLWENQFTQSPDATQGAAASGGTGGGNYFSTEEADIVGGFSSNDGGGGGAAGGGPDGVGGSASMPAQGMDDPDAGGGSPQGAAPSGPVSGDLRTFMAAIRRLESGSFSGNYTLRGPVVPTGAYAGQRAMGAYQIMPGNWPSWSREAGIAGADWRPPPNQDRVAGHKFNEYYRTYGNWDATAVAWFAGPSRARRYVQGEDLSGVGDVVGTNVPTYVRKIREYMREFSGQRQQPNAAPRGGLEMVGHLGEGTPSGSGSTGGGPTLVMAQAPSSTATQTRQVNVNMNIRVEKATREEAEKLAAMVAEIVEREKGIDMVSTR